MRILAFSKNALTVLVVGFALSVASFGCQNAAASGGGNDAIVVILDDAGSSADAGSTGGGQDVGVHDTGQSQGDPANGNDSCVSGSHWQGYSGYQMRPGDSCARCHGNSFAVAGTVYSEYHEETNCNGFSGATVEIIDANGDSQTIRTNSAGNFAATAWDMNIAMPYTAKVHYQGKTREMVTPQTNGDCNSCHARQGRNSAPGRIVVPY